MWNNTCSRQHRMPLVVLLPVVVLMLDLLAADSYRRKVRTGPTCTRDWPCTDPEQPSQGTMDPDPHSWWQEEAALALAQV